MNVTPNRGDFVNPPPPDRRRQLGRSLAESFAGFAPTPNAIPTSPSVDLRKQLLPNQRPIGSDPGVAESLRTGWPSWFRSCGPI